MNPLEHPEIDPHYLEEEYGEFSQMVCWGILHSFWLSFQDTLSFVECVKFARRIAQEKPLKRIFKGMQSVHPVMTLRTDSLLFLLCRRVTSRPVCANRRGDH